MKLATFTTQRVASHVNTSWGVDDANEMSNDANKTANHANGISGRFRKIYSRSVRVYTN